MPADCFEVIDDRFRKLFVGAAQIDKLFTGCRWAEGPAYLPAGRSLVWSDIPNDRMLRLDECSGAVSVFRQPAGYANGNTVDRLGRLVTCEQGTRRLSRTESDGKVSVLADSFRGGRLNSPNDVIVKSDQSIWFTDPTYGVDTDYEGHRGQIEQAGNFVFRLDPDGSELSVAADDFVQPNGLAFSPDERILYIVDSGRTHRPDEPAHIRSFALDESSEPKDRGVFAECLVGIFDGLRVDTEGRVWVGAGAGVHCYHPLPLEKSRLPGGANHSQIIEVRNAVCA